MKATLKKVLSMVLVIALTAGIAVTGTMAYLTSEDSDVNVMTLGNVKIIQHEYQRALDENGAYKTATIDDQESYVLKAFDQAKPLLPIVGDPSLTPGTPGYAGVDSTPVRMSQVDSYGGMDVFAGKNAVDKFVTVANTGLTDAYVRTLVAVEIGSGNSDLIQRSYHFTWKETIIGDIEVDGNKYALIEYVYQGAEGVRHENGILPAGDTSYPSLSQVYLKSVTTNEDCEKLDGNGNGMLDILVFSQAVQDDGFENAEKALDTAFGDITTENHPWVKGIESAVKVVSTVDELNEALKDSSVSEIVLTKGNYGLVDVTGVNRTLTISAVPGNEVTFSGIDGTSNGTTTDLTVKGITIDNSLQADGWYTGTAPNIKPCVGVWGGNYSFEDCTFVVSGESGAETGVMSWWTTNHGVMNFTNCVFNGNSDSARAMQIYGDYDLNVTGCTFNTKKDYSLKFVGEEGCVATFKNNIVKATENFVQTGSALYAGNNYELVFEGNDLADGINHVYIDNDENQTISIDGETKAANTGAIY